jgi:hypothetical protein
MYFLNNKKSEQDLFCFISILKDLFIQKSLNFH